MSSLPEELYFDIFQRLPVKSTLVCKCVCKNWYSLISNPNFVKMHHNLTIQRTNFSLMISEFDYRKLRNVICSLSYDPLSFSSNEFHLYGVEIGTPLGCLQEDIQVVGSCNGFVCFWSQEKEFFCLWNFDTNEYKELPKSRNKPVDRIISSYAFGYDYSSGDYKVICLFSMGDISLVDVYKMGPNSWKSTQVIPYVMDTQVESGMLVNGFFHWLGHRIDNFSDVIISLDISIERFQVLQPRNIHLVKRWLSVGVLKECLCILDNCGVNVEVWVMQDYGVQESWTRHYTITHERILYDHTLRLMWSFSSAEVLFVSGGSYLTDLVLFDPKDGSARKPNMHVENQVFTFPKAMSTIILKA